jgi:hypothetical protein
MLAGVRDDFLILFICLICAFIVAFLWLIHLW